MNKYRIGVTDEFIDVAGQGLVKLHSIEENGFQFNGLSAFPFNLTGQVLKLHTTVVLQQIGDYHVIILVAE